MSSFCCIYVRPYTTDLLLGARAFASDALPPRTTAYTYMCPHTTAYICRPTTRCLCLRLLLIYAVHTIYHTTDICSAYYCRPTTRCLCLRCSCAPSGLTTRAAPRKCKVEATVYMAPLAASYTSSFRPLVYEALSY